LTLAAPSRDTTIHLPHRFIAPGSDTLRVLSYGILRRGADYMIGYGSGTIRFDAASLARIRSILQQEGSPGHTMVPGDNVQGNALRDAGRQTTFAAERTVPPMSSSDTLLRRPFVVDERVYRDSTAQAVLTSDTVIREPDATVATSRGTIAQATATGDTIICIVTYSYIPLQLQDVYQLRTLAEAPDTVSRTDSIRILRPASTFSMDDIFGPNLQKSGSIVRGFTVGSNRDLSLNSGLRLQMSGRILSDVEVTAALTDENTPIQPEGTTQTLQEFDKVFVELKGTNAVATLGDFNLDFTGTEFARLNRKLQGAKGYAQYRLGGIDGATMVSGAVTRGKFTTKQFTGTEGVQGPYILTGANNERDIIIIAGTERVYIDGEQQTRGETNDYIIDYSTCELTFTTRRLITSASRIVVDFEYTDRQFSRSLFAAQSAAALFDNSTRLTVSYAREADDPDAPIDFVFSDSARAVLAAAGPDREKAVLNGVTRVDSNGLYVRIDTLLSGGAPATFYRYAPGDPLALYTVTFSYVGPGRGEYSRQRAGVFVWQGEGRGDYRPVRYLPLPQSHQLVDVNLDVAPAQDLKLAGEFGFSTFDANRLSSLGDGENNGRAYNFSAVYEPRDLRLGGLSLGGMKLRYRERYVGNTFVPLDRANDIEFTRKWGVDSLAGGDERIREAAVTFLPAEGISAGTSYGTIRRGDEQDSRRVDGTLSVRTQHLPVLLYGFENVSSTDHAANLESRWFRHKGSIEYTFLGLTPGARYEGEDRSIATLGSALAQPGSFKFNAYGVFLRLAELGPLSAQADFSWRSDDLYYSGAVTRESDAFTQNYTARLREWETVSSTLDVTLRRKQYAAAFRQQGRQDVQTVLVRNQTRVAPLNRGVETDLFYEVSTEQSSRLERVYVRVTPGSGNYRYLGDLNGNGLADEQEFELTRFDGEYVALTLPTDQLTPIIDLKTSARLRVTPQRFVQTGGLAGDVLRALTTETYVRIEEKSSEPDLKQIYLLHFSRFREDATTIAGSALFTQDVHLFEGKPSFSSRLRFSERRGLTNFSSGIEHAYVRERSIRLRWQLVSEIANQLDVVNRTDRVGGSSTSPRVRDILSNGVTFDVSYRPQQSLELGFKVDVSRATDSHPLPELRADLNAQSLRLVYAFQGAGQARGEFAREEVLLARGAASFPYELTGGRIAGKTWVWRSAFEYRITQFLQATVNYEGRSEGGNSPVHNARAEIRAFF